MERPNTTCSICGKPIYRTPKALARTKNVTCSAECKRIAYGGRDFTCPVCGKPFRLSPALARRNKTPCCSKACRETFGFKTGPEHGNWKGGRYVTSHGYVKIRMPDHPRAYNGYVWEHLVVLEEKLGRFIVWPEVCHHINGDKADNRPENLMVEIHPNAHRLNHHLYYVSRVGNSKLTWDQVDEIRRRYKEGGITQVALAKEYGLTPGSIYSVIAGRTWNPTLRGLDHG